MCVVAGFLGRPKMSLHPKCMKKAHTEFWFSIYFGVCQLLRSYGIENQTNKFHISLFFCDQFWIQALFSDVQEIQHRSDCKVLGASEISANLFCNSRTYVLERLRDYLRLLMNRSVYKERGISSWSLYARNKNNRTLLYPWIWKFAVQPEN